MTSLKNIKKNGFTIVESLVALAVLVTAIVGVFKAVSTSTSSYTLSRDQVTAFYLAQEGFEFLRNMRDQNALNGSPFWLTGIAADSDDPCRFGIACTVDTVLSTTPIECGLPGTCPVLRQHLTEFYFGYDPTWSATQFTRQIVLTQINPNEITVAVTVSWPHGATTRQFKAKENLFNWP